MRAPLPPNEEARLRALHEYEILDTPPEQAYEDLVQIASSICGTSIAAVSLIDRDRQFFKASKGLEFRETPRELSFCSFTILDPESLLVVEDATKDPRFLGNDLVTDVPHIRFYAGAPLVTEGGEAIGSLCVIATEPKSISAEQKAALAALARQTMAQLELRRSNRLIERQAHELERALDATEQAMQARSQFVSNMSHEIRTPLNGVLGMTDLLESTNLSDRQRRYVSMIRQSGEGLLNVLNGLLEVSQSANASTEIQTPVRGLIEEIVALMQPAAVTKRLRLNARVDDGLAVPVEVDAMRVRQILTNLVGNAIKFTTDGWVEVRAKIVGSETDRVRVRIEVEDTGVGMPTPTTGDGFQKYEESDVARSHTFGGAGLGLSITRRFVESLGGTLEFRTEAGIGTTFAFEIDLSVPEAFRLRRGRRVLVVDDNEVNSMVISAMLEQNGCEVELAENGLEAVEMMRKESFDLVFMDLMMPVMDGATATREVRAMEEPSRHTPIVAVTASALDEDAVRCREAGMDEVIRKPINERVIVDALDRFLSKPA